ncbi:MAG: hypothetical protein ACLFO6_07810 [Archaeoglobaceae archaeon]
MRMRRPLKIVIGLVVIVAIVGALWIYHTNSLYEQSFTAEYRYRVNVDLETGSSINNVTIHVPIPSDGRDVPEDLTGPDDWDLSIVDTEHGRMLKISADRIETHRSTPSPLEPGEEPGEELQAPADEVQAIQLNRITQTITTNKEINTADPQRSEPLLHPKYNLTTTECWFPHGEEQRLKCYKYRSAGFVYYESDSDVSLTISITFEGTNSWWIYGWTGNEYRDRIYLTSEGEKGWLNPEGQLVIGWGTYR